MRGWSAMTRSSTSSPTSSKASSRTSDRIFTFKLRDGHKWSDGSPLTSEDFRYSGKTCCLNEDLSPGGVLAGAAGRRQAAGIRGRRPAHRSLQLGRAQSRFPAAARRRRSRSAWSCRPHYMKQFHEKYQDKDKLDELMKKNKAKNWTALHIKHGAPVPAGESRPADARSVAQHHQAAGRAVRLRAQPLFPPRRRERPCSCPISTVHPQRQLVRRSSRPRPAPARATCRSPASTSPTTPS